MVSKVVFASKVVREGGEMSIGMKRGQEFE